LPPHVPLRPTGSTAAAISDADNQRLAQLVAGGGSTSFSLGGLRSGTMRVSGRTITLRRYEYVPGVTATGKLSLSTGGTITVAGRAAAPGSLTFAPSGAVSGKLGGRRVSIAAAAPGARRTPSRAPWTGYWPCASGGSLPCHGQRPGTRVIAISRTAPRQPRRLAALG
jgi:hypothetical protein